MQDNQAHAGQHTLVDALDDCIVDLIVSHVPPPQEHIRLCQDILSQAMLWIIECGGANGEPFGAQAFSNCPMDPFWIDFSNDRINFLMTALIPNSDTRCRCHFYLLRITYDKSKILSHKFQFIIDPSA